MLCSWEGNHKSGHRLSGLSTYGLNGFDRQTKDQCSPDGNGPLYHKTFTKLQNNVSQIFSFALPKRSEFIL